MGNRLEDMPSYCAACDTVHPNSTCMEYQKSLENYSRRYDTDNDPSTGKRLKRPTVEDQRKMNHEITEAAARLDEVRLKGTLGGAPKAIEPQACPFCVDCSARHSGSCLEHLQKMALSFATREMIVPPGTGKTKEVTATELRKSQLAMVKYVPRYLENMGVMVHKDRVYINLVCEDGTRVTLNMDTVMIKALGREEDKNALAEWISDKRKQVDFK